MSLANCKALRTCTLRTLERVGFALGWKLLRSFTKRRFQIENFRDANFRAQHTFKTELMFIELFLITTDNEVGRNESVSVII